MSVVVRDTGAPRGYGDIHNRSIFRDGGVNLSPQQSGQGKCVFLLPLKLIFVMGLFLI